jgi:hypothetical protein
MAYRSKLTEEQWIMVQAEYELGLSSDRALAMKWGVGHTAIGDNAKKRKWKKPFPRKGIMNISTNEVNVPSLLGQFVKYTACERVERMTESIYPDRLKRELMELGREEAMASAIETMRQVTLLHMRGAGRLRRMALDVHDKLQALLNGDEEDKAKAAEVLLGSGKDSLAGLLSTLAKLESTAQYVERNALGLNSKKDDPKTAEGNGTITNDSQTGQPVIDVQNLTDDQLKALTALNRTLDEQRGTDLPLPPKGPEDER